MAFCQSLMTCLVLNKMAALIGWSRLSSQAHRTQALLFLISKVWVRVLVVCKALNQYCVVLRMGRKAPGPVCFVMHVLIIGVFPSVSRRWPPSVSQHHVEGATWIGLTIHTILQNLFKKCISLFKRRGQLIAGYVRYRYITLNYYYCQTGRHRQVFGGRFAVWDQPRRRIMNMIPLTQLNEYVRHTKLSW